MLINRKELCKILIISIAFLQFIKPFIFANFSKLTFVLGVLLFFSSISIVRKTFKKPAIIFFVLGIFLLSFNDTPLQTLIVGTNSMLNIIAILAVMQLFTIPIRTGRYNKAIEYFLFNKVKNKSTLYLFTMGTTHIFASFLLFGTIPVVLYLMGEAIKR